MGKGLAELLREYKGVVYGEAVGERPTGELHPDLAGEQEKYEAGEADAKLEEKAKGIFDEIGLAVEDVIKAKFNEAVGDDEELRYAFKRVIDDYSSEERGHDLETYGLAWFAYTTLWNSGLLKPKGE